MKRLLGAIGVSLILLATLTKAEVDGSKISTDSRHRQGKIFSLFSIVNFQNAPCTSTSSISSASTAYRNGTCYTTTECSDKGGSIKGSCAAGFGACCVFVLDDKDSTTVNYNETYIQNPNYPNTYQDTTSLSYTINKCSDDVCFFRLDFEQFNIMGPSVTDETNGGSCVDTFTITVNSGQSIPVICGNNQGQHIYLSVGNKGSDSATAVMAFSSDSSSRQWEMKVSQIPCGSYAPPDGCLQWNTGLTGRLTTFNYADTSSSHLASQDYNICIRQEAGYCCVQYQVCPDESSNDSFTLSAFADKEADRIATQDSQCTADYVTIAASSATCSRSPGVNGNTKYCGSYLGSEGQAKTVTSMPICDCTGPFMVGIYTNANNDDTGEPGARSIADSNQGTNRGVCLTYNQIPC